jgi:hypothetical protein
MSGRRTGSCSAPCLRRVAWVRLDLEPGRPVRAVAVGVAHRLPVTVPISLHRAAQLSADGVPVVVHRSATTASA